MLKKAAKEAVLAAPPVGTAAGYFAGYTIAEWAAMLSLFYTIILIARAFGVPTNKLIPQLCRCGKCIVLNRRCVGTCPR